jgi:uncharacterized protein YegL
MADYSEIVVVLDRSGSMHYAKADHEGGLNSFIRDQKELEGEVRLTFIQFDDSDPCEIIYDNVRIEDVGEITMLPRGGTPLLDAVGRSIAHVAGRLDKSERKPDQVVVMVITDGQENASREYNKKRISDLIKDREDKHGWKFLFLGANIDAFGEGGAMGFSSVGTAGYVNKGPQVAAMYGAISSNTRSARMCAARGMGAEEVYSNYAFSGDQLSAMGSGEQPTAGDPATFQPTSMDPAKIDPVKPVGVSWSSSTNK